MPWPAPTTKELVDLNLVLPTPLTRLDAIIAAIPSAP